MIFKRLTFLSIFALIAGAVLLSWQLGIISEKDLLAYQALASLSNLKSANPVSEPYSAKQERYKIVKEFYLEDEHKTKRFVRLKSRASSLCFEQKDRGKEIVEKMQDVVCLIQERLYTDADGNIMQSVQQIRCNEATYHYQTQTLDANTVIVERYTLPGNVLPKNFDGINPFFQSTATHTLFSLDKGMVFQAEGIEASHALSGLCCLKADKASYFENHLFLFGNVQFEHPVGTVHAGKADISLNETSQISSIFLEDAIHVTLKDKSSLQASYAEIDCIARKSKFLGEKVRYKGNGFDLESLSMDMAWSDVKGAAPTKNMLTTLLAEHEVVIHYGDRIQAWGDSASYGSNEVLLKTLCDTPCKVIFDSENQILADSLRIQLVDRIATFSNPDGFIHNQNDSMLFSAQSLEWNDQKHILTLKGNVIVEDHSYGILKTNDPVAIYLHEDRSLSKIDCEGESFFAHVDENGDAHYLTITGKFILDQNEQRLTMRSKDGEKMTFKDHHGHIMANSGDLIYEMQNGKLTPKQLLLEGDVCIINQFASQRDSLSQYVLSDIADYSFSDRELTLSQQENRVLFYDKVNQIELSAPALKIKRDAAAEKESIRGVGDVRFVFATQELEKLKSRFKFGEGPLS